jgi:hypothetical protein
VSPWEEEVSPPLPTGSRVEPFDGASHHGPLQERWPTMGGPMMMAPKLPSRRERFRPLNRSMMNSRLPTRMVLPWGKPSPRECSPLVTGMNIDDDHRNILRKARYKSPFLAHQLLVFFVPARYRVVKIMCSYSKVVL